MLLMAAERLRLQLPNELREQLTAYLLESQIDQQEEYRPVDLEFGGWDMEGTSHHPRKTTGTNISVGAVVSEALARQESAGAQTALQNYRQWLSKCQNSSTDGGFFFHTDTANDGNKAGWAMDGDRADSARPLSYGSATADGLRGLKACGVDPQSAPFQAAVDWIRTHADVDRVPGFQSSQDKSWADGLLFYYWFTLAKSVALLPGDVRMQIAGKIRGELLRRQTVDGYWQNDSARMREDDPLIATSFAIVALAILDESDGSDKSKSVAR